MKGAVIAASIGIGALSLAWPVKTYDADCGIAAVAIANGYGEHSTQPNGGFLDAAPAPGPARPPSLSARTSATRPPASRAER